MGRQHSRDSERVVEIETHAQAQTENEWVKTEENVREREKENEAANTIRKLKLQVH